MYIILHYYMKKHLQKGDVFTFDLVSMCCLHLQDLAGRQRRLGDAERQFRSLGPRSWFMSIIPRLRDHCFNEVYKGWGARPTWHAICGDGMSESQHPLGLWNTKTLCKSEVPSEPKPFQTATWSLKLSTKPLDHWMVVQTVRWLWLFLTDQSTPKSDLVEFCQRGCGVFQPLEWKNASHLTQLRHLFRGSQWAAPCRWLLRYSNRWPNGQLIDESGEKDDTFGKHLPKWHPELLR